MIEKYFENKLLPAVTLGHKDDALNVANALLEGGLNVMEITFRTQVAAESIVQIRNKMGNMIVGAGTLLSPQQVQAAKKAGAHFGVAPGLNTEVVKEAQKLDFPFIPGIVTPSEVEQAIGLECPILKVFPAEPIGGIALLKALSGPYRHTEISFIPRGGINTDNIQSYLNRPNVLAVGGSWLAPKKVIRNKDFQIISENIKVAMNISKKFR